MAGGGEKNAEAARIADATPALASRIIGAEQALPLPDSHQRRRARQAFRARSPGSPAPGRPPGGRPARPGKAARNRGGPGSRRSARGCRRHWPPPCCSRAARRNQGAAGRSAGEQQDAGQQDQAGAHAERVGAEGRRGQRAASEGEPGAPGAQRGHRHREPDQPGDADAQGAGFGELMEGARKGRGEEGESAEGKGGSGGCGRRRTGPLVWMSAGRGEEDERPTGQAREIAFQNSDLPRRGGRRSSRGRPATPARRRRSNSRRWRPGSAPAGTARSADPPPKPRSRPPAGSRRAFPRRAAPPKGAPGRIRGGRRRQKRR